MTAPSPALVHMADQVLAALAHRGRFTPTVDVCRAVGHEADCAAVGQALGWLLTRGEVQVQRSGWSGRHEWQATGRDTKVRGEDTNHG